MNNILEKKSDLELMLSLLTKHKVKPDRRDQDDTRELHSGEKITDKETTLFFELNGAKFRVSYTNGEIQNFSQSGAEVPLFAGGRWSDPTHRQVAAMINATAKRKSEARQICELLEGVIKDEDGFEYTEFTYDKIKLNDTAKAILKYFLDDGTDSASTKEIADAVKVPPAKALRELNKLRKGGWFERGNTETGNLTKSGGRSRGKDGFSSTIWNTDWDNSDKWEKEAKKLIGE